MHWKFKDYPGVTKKGVDKFLATGAPLPESAKLIGRWHAAGSQYGWLIIETDNITDVYEHASVWADMLTLTVTPVVTDEEAGPICAKIWGESAEE